MRLPGNISYFLKPKRNRLLPDYFDDYLLNTDLKPYSVLNPDYYHKKLINSKYKINVSDFGAGSNKFKSDQRIVSDIASISGTNLNFGLFYHKLIQQFNITNILELGTSVGIGTMYMATASNAVKLTGIEACPETCEFLTRKLEKANIRNVNLINDDFDSVFDKNLLSDQKFDMIFIDGNHKGEALLKYYEIILKKHLNPSNIVIVDDINWSRDMYLAWKTIVNKDRNKTYINLYRTGFVFTGYNLPKGAYPINFVKNRLF